MWGKATLTTVESRNAMPDPSTVAAMTHRPLAEANSSPTSPTDSGVVRVLSRLSRRKPVEHAAAQGGPPLLGRRIVRGLDQNEERAPGPAPRRPEQRNHPLVPGDGVERRGRIDGVACVDTERPRAPMAILGDEPHRRGARGVG